MKVNLNHILAFDIETVPLPDFSEEHPAFDCWANKNRKENLTSEELIEKYNKEAGLYAEYSRIVCLSYGYFHEGKVVLKSITGTEQEIVDAFLGVCDKFIGSRGNLICLGHNILDFDIPFLRKAFSRYHAMFDFPVYLTDINKKPWELVHLDTLKLHKGTSFMFASMAEVALLLGLPSPKTDTDGSMVASLFQNGEIERISTYCKGDVYTSICILCKWMGTPIPEKVGAVALSQGTTTVAPANKLVGEGNGVVTTEITQQEPVDFLKELPLLQKMINKGGKLSATDTKALKKAIKPYENSKEWNLIKAAILAVNPNFEI